MLYKTGLTEEESDFIKNCMKAGIEFDENTQWVDLPKNIEEDLEEGVSITALNHDLWESTHKLLQVCNDLTAFPSIWSWASNGIYVITIELRCFCSNNEICLNITASREDDFKKENGEDT